MVSWIESLGVGQGENGNSGKTGEIQRESIVIYRCWLFSSDKYSMVMQDVNIRGSWMKDIQGLSSLALRFFFLTFKVVIKLKHLFKKN